MRRVITVDLVGNAYPLEEDAYERLRAYISLVEARASGSDRAAVVAEVERAIVAQLVSRNAASGIVSDAVMAEVLSIVGGAEAVSAAASGSRSSSDAPSTCGERPESEFTRVPVFLLCLFLGLLGVHRFYVGKIGTGVLQLLTLGGLGLWLLYDLIVIVFGAFTDGDGRKIVRWS
jgi:hypothetical protein